MRPDQLELLTEVANVGIGRAASLLNSLLETHIELVLPHSRMLASGMAHLELERFGGDILSCVELGFSGDLEGTVTLVFPPTSANKLVSILLRDDDPLHEEFDELRASTLNEVGNIVLNSVMGSMANMLGKQFTYSVPVFRHESVSRLCDAARGNLVMVETLFRAGAHQIEGEILMFFGLDCLERLSDYLTRLEEQYV